MLCHHATGRSCIPNIDTYLSSQICAILLLHSHSSKSKTVCMYVWWHFIWARLTNVSNGPGLRRQLPLHSELDWWRHTAARSQPSVHRQCDHHAAGPPARHHTDDDCNHLNLRKSWQSLTSLLFTLAYCFHDRWDSQLRRILLTLLPWTLSHLLQHKCTTQSDHQVNSSMPSFYITSTRTSR